MAVVQQPDQVGRVLEGRYRLLAPIGRGSSAIVYLAHDTVLRRRVAIKILHTALAGDRQFLRRFQGEARTAAALNHPHIMRVIDWGDDRNAPFLVLEYLGGGSLRQVLDEQESLTVAQVAQVGMQAARALSYAHRRGLVHRDIKPANLLFDEEGRLAIADFGLARALSEAALTEPGGSVLGTIRYASPEQAKGLDLTTASDVYALALVLIEAGSGSMPLLADTTIATLMARMTKPVEVPESLGALRPILQQATSQEAERRLTASDLAKQLEPLCREGVARLPLPGALPLDLDTDSDSEDLTMMPGLDEHDFQNGSSPDEPMPLPVPTVRKRGLFSRKTKGATRSSEELASAGPKARAAVDRKDRRSEDKALRPRGFSWRRALVTLLLAALIAGLGVGGTQLYYQTGRHVAAPEMVHLSRDAAKLAAQEAGVKVAFSDAFSEEVPPGQVISQSTMAGERMSVRETLDLTISKGPAPRAVPGVVGKKLEDATSILGEAGFVVEDRDIRRESSEDRPRDEVLSQEAEGGQHEKGSHVGLTVSSGPRARVIPSVSGMNQAQAEEALRSQQLKSRITQDFSDTVPAGQIVGTSPAAGASVARDSTVSIVVSRGPEMITVPDVTGLSISAATERLSAAGLSVTATYGPPSATSVFSSSPGAGTKVKKGSEVSLYKR